MGGPDDDSRAVAATWRFAAHSLPFCYHGSQFGKAWEALFGAPIVFSFTGAVIAASIGSLPLVILYAFFVEHYVSAMTGAVKE